MSRKWESRRLGDVIAVKHGFAFPGAEFSDDPDLPTLVTPGNFAIGGGFQQSKPKTFAGDYPPQFLLGPRDVVVTMTDLSKAADTLGYAASIPDDGRVYLHNQRIGKVVARVPDVDLAFVSYLLRTPAYRHWIVGSASGSTVKHTSPSRIEDFKTNLPPYPEQRRIAAVLSSLDDLIEHNRTQIELLNQLWRSIVQSGLARGGDLIKLSDLARFVNGRNFTKDASGIGLPVIRTPEVRNGPSLSTVRNDVEAQDDNIARLGDILFVWSGSLLVDRWAYEPGLVNQHIFKVMPNDGVPTWLVLWSIEELMADFLGVAADKATTMGHIKRADLDRTVAVPPRPDWPALDATVAPLFDLAMDLQAEVIESSRTRDELLPLLMSGDIRVDQTLEVSA